MFVRVDSVTTCSGASKILRRVDIAELPESMGRQFEGGSVSRLNAFHHCKHEKNPADSTEHSASGAADTTKIAPRFSFRQLAFDNRPLRCDAANALRNALRYIGPVIEPV